MNWLNLIAAIGAIAAIVFEWFLVIKDWQGFDRKFWPTAVFWTLLFAALAALNISLL